MGNMLYWYTFLKYAVLTELLLPGNDMVESHRHNIKQRNYIHKSVYYIIPLIRSSRRNKTTQW